MKTSRLILLVAAALAGAPAAAASQEPPDPAVFTAVLEDVVEPPLVDYAELQDQRGGLDAWLQALEDTSPGALEAASEDARLAFWINAYNACMLRLVVDHYPLVEQGSGFFGRIANFLADRPENSVWRIDDVFSREHCPVAGEPRSQDEIEHEIIRPVFEDPRIHFVVNCAARSCPTLRREAYRGDSLDAQLDRAVLDFVDTPRHFRLEEGEDGAVLRVNKVLDWYRDDFGGLDGIKAFFRPYVDAETASVLAQPDTEVAFFEYDWTLNDTAVAEGDGR